MLRVLIVDDSRFFRRRIRELLASDAGLRVVGEAADGRQALEQVESLRPDVVTMDIEMPVMDGISASREIMRRRPTPILMFSSLTYEGAKATLDGLEAGALDFMPKRFSEIAADSEEARRRLCEKVRAVGRGRARVVAPAPARGAPATPPAAPRPPAAEPARGRFHMVAIGTSTGGPVALQQVLAALPADYPLPLLLVQHMPGNFTRAFAERLNQLCAIEVREAARGDELRPGLALLAPGGHQIGLRRSNGRLLAHVFDLGDDQIYRPSVDIAFAEAARVHGGRVLAVVMTGMGCDGCDGARQLKSAGAEVWAQDEASSVIYGMPAAVARAGLADRVLPLPDIGPALARVR